MMGLTWYILGLLTTGSAIFIWNLSRKYDLNWKAWLGLALGVILALFAIAWGVGAVLEGVPRAGSMGILFFGLPGIVLFSATYSYSTKLPEKHAQTTMVNKKEASCALDIPMSKPKRFRKSKWSALLTYSAYISLILAYVIGIVINDDNYEALIEAKYPELELKKIHENPVVFQIGEKINGNGEYILIQEGQGYGGPFVFGLRIREDAKIHGVIPLSDKETPAFIKKIRETNFLDQFIGKSISDNFVVDGDIDGVSGATVTVTAATDALRNGAHIAAVDYFKLDQTWKKKPWKFGLDEVLVIVVFILAFLPKMTKTPYKYILMGLSIGIIGFYLNGSVSIGSISGLMMGYIPSISDHMVWWVLVVGTLVGIVVLGKNVYCYKICPFYGIQYLMNKLGANRYKPSPTIIGNARTIANFLLWLALMVIFILRLPSAGAYEPFAMMFSLEGVDIQWYILPLAVIGSFFVSLFWCRFFCPVGSVFTVLLKMRKEAIKVFNKN